MEDSGSLLTLRHKQAEMSLLSPWLDARINALSLDRATGHAVRLCLEEVVLNVITHGAPPFGEERDILIELDRTGSGLFARVEDYGPPFDPLSVEDKQRPGTIQEAPLGGLGIRLIRAFASDVRYCRVGNLNRLMLEFKEHPSHP